MAMSKQRRKPVKAKASQQAQARRPSLRTLWQQHSVNLGTADAVYAALREAIISGVLKPGDSIPAKIEEGLERSRVLVLCMSANAFGSDWAQLESGTFRFRDPLNKERRFLPLRLDDARR